MARKQNQSDKFQRQLRAKPTGKAVEIDKTTMFSFSNAFYNYSPLFTNNNSCYLRRALSVSPDPLARYHPDTTR